MCRHPLAASTFALLTFLATALLGSSSILCFGFDGHMEIEEQAAGCCNAADECCEEGPDGRPAGALTAPTTHPCGPCIDVPLLPLLHREAIRPTGDRCMSPAESSLSCAGRIPHWTTAPPAGGGFPFHAVPPVPPGALALILTVTLRC